MSTVCGRPQGGEEGVRPGRCDHVVFAEASGSFSLAAMLVKHWLGNLCYTRSGDFEQILIYDKLQFYWLRKFTGQHMEDKGEDSLLAKKAKKKRNVGKSCVAYGCNTSYYKYVPSNHRRLLIPTNHWRRLIPRDQDVLP